MRRAEINDHYGLGGVAIHAGPAHARLLPRLLSRLLTRLLTRLSRLSRLCSSTAQASGGPSAALDKEHMYSLLLGHLLQANRLPVTHSGHPQVPLGRGHLEAGDPIEAVGGRENHCTGLPARTCTTDSILLVHAIAACTRPLATGAGSVFAYPARLVRAVAATGGDENDLQVSATHGSTRHLRLTLAGTGHAPACSAARGGALLLIWEKHNDVGCLALLQLDGGALLHGLLYSLRIGLSKSVLTRLLTGLLPWLLTGPLTGLLTRLARLTGTILLAWRSASALVALRVGG